MNDVPLFSSGLELANLAVSSGLLRLLWAKISELYREMNRNEGIRFGVYNQQQPNCIIVAFVTSPSCTKQLHEEAELISSSSLPQFNFPCTRSNSSFSIHKSAAALFASIHNQLSSFTTQLGNSIPTIITGHSLGGSVASLFTLQLLESINRPGPKLPLCITFGSPLIGDKGLQQTVSQHLTWNSCFLHVASSQDLVPRLFISPHNPNVMEIDSQTCAYKPFGTFLLCSEYGCSCLEDPEAVSKLLAAMGSGLPGNQNLNEQWCIVDYGEIVEHLMSIVVFKGISNLDASIKCSLRAGLVLQLEAIGVKRRQQNSDIKLLTEKMEKWERTCVLKRKTVFDPFKKLNDKKIYMAYLEWYKKDSKTKNKGYYDRYKNKGFLKEDMEVVKFKKYLTNYWEDMVSVVQKMPQKEEASFRTRWLYAGTNYRRMVEPLDIAEYYKDKGLTDYKNHGRSQHYVQLEKWLEEAGKPPSSVEAKKQKVSASLTEDSCFWAYVEEALIQCKLLRSGEGRELPVSNLIKFEEYVMEQIKNYAVSPEIFLEGSSFMQWWKEYEEVIGTSYNSNLIQFMKNGHYTQYACGSL